MVDEFTFFSRLNQDKAREKTFRIKESADRLRREIKNNIVTAVLAALGFIIALAWRDAIQEAVNKILTVLDLTGEAYIFRIISALIITAIAVVGIIYISRFQEKEEVKEQLKKRGNKK